MHVEVPDHGELPQSGPSRGRGVRSTSRPLSPESEDMSRSAEDRIYDLFMNQRYAECHDLDTLSDGSMSPDLGDMWHHGYPVSPQWEGQLELDSMMVHGMRDSISIMRECSLRLLIRDSLCPPDVTRLRTPERRWNNAELKVEFAALWFFLMTKNEAMPTSHSQSGQACASITVVTSALRPGQ